MESYASSSTLLIFDVASASFTVGMSVLWHLGDFWDSWVKEKAMRGWILSFLSHSSLALLPPTPQPDALFLN